MVFGGVRPFQEQPIIHILNGKDDLQCTATGDGKSALSFWYGAVVETRQDGLLMDMLLAHVIYLRNGTRWW